jgi:hypothetical protein
MKCATMAPMFPRLVLAVLLALATAGCGRIKKASECNTFIDKVNASLKEIEKHTAIKGKDDAETIAEMKKLGELYEALAKDVGGMELSVPELGKLGGEYKQMAERASQATRTLAGAIEAKDQEKAQQAQKDFDQIVKQEDELVSKINSFCQAS